VPTTICCLTYPALYWTTPRTDGARRWWPRPCRRRRAGTRRTAVKLVDLLLDLPHLMMASTRP
jgi:hypothetical protein